MSVVECAVAAGICLLAGWTAVRRLHHARLALKARRANSWAAAVPWDIFLNDVLPYRNLDEPIDIDWRSMFLKRFGPMVAAASSLTEAAQLLNR
jgi:hypothetical protein